MKKDLKKWHEQCNVFEDMLLEIHNYKDNDIQYVKNCAHNIHEELESLRDNISMVYGKITIEEKI